MKKKYWLLLLLPVLIILVLLIKNFKDGQKKELQADKDKEQIASNTSLPEPTAYPNIQPHCVLLDGKLLMAVGTTDDDLSEKTVGTIQTLLDDPRRLPIIDEQTNFGPYKGCEYAQKDGAWYLCYEEKWYLLQADSGQ